MSTFILCVFIAILASVAVYFAAKFKIASQDSSANYEKYLAVYEQHQNLLDEKFNRENEITILRNQAEVLHKDVANMVADNDAKNRVIADLLNEQLLAAQVKAKASAVKTKPVKAAVKAKVVKKKR